MDIIVYAIPIFLVMIVMEVVATIIRKKDYYRLNDAINSLSAGMMSITSGIISKIVEIAIYTGIFSLLAPIKFDSSELWVWIVAFVFYDFCYYWTHRMGHEINILWAAHAVHHQSEEYNLTTALRQSSSKFLLGWLFYIPMAVAGIPPLVFFTVGLINLLYQFWVHTRHIKKLGWYENFFVTPSNHRVHHAKNRKYLDKNYGGVFIIWDRIFGTFQEEDENYESIRYGTLKPLRSWNPFWANLHLYSDMWKDARATKSWKDKFTLWFKKTGYRPADVAAPMKMPDIHGYQNYDPTLSRSRQIYVGVQFFILIIATTGLMAVYHTTPTWFDALWITVLGINLVLNGTVMEKPDQAMKLECLRFGITGIALAGTAALLPVASIVWVGLIVITAASLACLRVFSDKHESGTAAIES
ncbi:sterol desaturase family protein [Endozoicomonas arenosclerae]|uniref:sterol desaturase family protein n=1 Tax=Endozoicomonas arenosclerae TaxID=1633495 RepID=UPI0007827034|nr:sterol desaturase family protein [Endozoicomonas arenosclerae]